MAHFKYLLALAVIALSLPATVKSDGFSLFRRATTCAVDGDCPADAAKCCSLQCADLQTDVANCAACGTACPAITLPHMQASCAAGKCGKVCSAGYADCNRRASDGCETSLGDDVRNCGACRKRCPAGRNTVPTCTEGTCGNVCKPSFGNCDDKDVNGCETPLVTIKNCGACGNACASAPNMIPKCTKGECVAKCVRGFGDCNGDMGTDGCEVSFDSDLANCGACGNACPEATLPNTEAFCRRGKCGIRCTTGFFDCNRDLTKTTSDGCEANVSTDALNCGRCNKKCPASRKTCSDGRCSATTPATSLADTEAAPARGKGHNDDSLDSLDDVPPFEEDEEPKGNGKGRGKGH